MLQLLHLSETLIALVLQPMSFSMTGYKEFWSDFLIYLHFFAGDAIFAGYSYFLVEQKHLIVQSFCGNILSFS